MATVTYEDLSAAFDFVSFGAPMEHQAYISLDTGAIYWVSELNPVDEDIPDDLETSDRYVAVPHKNDLGLGNRLALDFVAAELPSQYETVQGFFRRPGAYGRFKEVLAGEGYMEKWYAFEAESAAKALKNWCSEHEIEITEKNDESA